jgi:hypothetical protein
MSAIGAPSLPRRAASLYDDRESGRNRAPGFSGLSPRKHAGGHAIALASLPQMLCAADRAVGIPLLYRAGDLASRHAALVSFHRRAMSHFVPPYPDRPQEALPPLAMLRAVRRNFLAAFDDKCFEYQFFTVRMLRRRLFVCNSPDTVAQAFIAKHASFERKKVRNRRDSAIGPRAPECVLLPPIPAI